MYKTEKTSHKRVYESPVIECITLDHEISLQLESTPPTGPGPEETRMNAPEYFNNDPYKMA